MYQRTSRPSSRDARVLSAGESLAEPRLAEWENKIAESPAMIAALGRRYSTLKQYDKLDIAWE